MPRLTLTRVLRGIAIVLTLAAFSMACVLGVVAAFSAGPSPRPISGALSAPRFLNRPVPAFRLRDEHGRRTSLAAFRGRWLVFAPALTLCREVCPLTTGALLQLRRRLVAAGLGERVTLAEITVDPWRDRPARLRAYRRRAGIHGVRLLTGSLPQIHRLWGFFAVFFRRVDADDPPDIDWLTHRPEHMDVEHTEALFIIDPRGRERWADVGMPTVGGRLPARLRSLLDAEGRRDLAQTGIPWTAGRVMRALAGLSARAN